MATPDDPKKKIADLYGEPVYQADSPEDAMNLINNDLASLVLSPSFTPSRPILGWEDYSLPDSLEDAYRRSIANQVGGLNDQARQAGEYARNLAATAMLTLAPTSLIKMLTGVDVTNNKAEAISKMAMQQSQRQQQLREQAMLQGRVLPSQMNIELEGRKAEIERLNQQGRQEVNRQNALSQWQDQVDQGNSAHQFTNDLFRLKGLEYQQGVDEEERQFSREDREKLRELQEMDRQIKLLQQQRLLNESNAPATLPTDVRGFISTLNTVNSALGSSADTLNRLDDSKGGFFSAVGRFFGMGDTEVKRLTGTLEGQAKLLGSFSNNLLGDFGKYKTALMAQGIPVAPELEQQVVNLAGRLSYLAQNPDEESFKQALSELKVLGSAVQSEQSEQPIPGIADVQDASAKLDGLLRDEAAKKGKIPTVTLFGGDLLRPDRAMKKVQKALENGEHFPAISIEGKPSQWQSAQDFRKGLEDVRKQVVQAGIRLVEANVDLGKIDENTSVEHSIKLGDVSSGKPYVLTAKVGDDSIERRFASIQEGKQFFTELESAVKEIATLKRMGGDAGRASLTGGMGGPVQYTFRGAPIKFDNVFTSYGDRISLKDRVIRVPGSNAIIFPK